jgi:hypothetical protein
MMELERRARVFGYLACFNVTSVDIIYLNIGLGG